MPNRRLFVAHTLAIVSALGMRPSRAGAGPLGRPQSAVILTISGAITETNGPGRAAFDRAMLERLGLSKLKTWTPWTRGVAEFEGVLARRVMAAVGATGTKLRATALNDYQCTIPLDDFERYDVLLAMRMNGQEMRIRDKGPVWIVYPWSDHPELDDFLTREKAVWQLTALDVR